MTVTDYTEYFVDTPGWFIDQIQQALGDRDLRSLTNERIEAIKVSSEHPLVQLTGSILQNNEPDHAGLIPSISVIEQPENEESTTIGDGIQVYRSISLAHMEMIKTTYADLAERQKEGLITDNQINKVILAIEQRATEYGVEPSTIELKAEVEAYWLRESIYVSLWTHHTNERNLLGKLLRSVVYKMRKSMRGRGLRDISIRTDKGLVNFNFGRLLHGKETEITFLNRMINISVTDEAVRDYDAYVIAEFTTRDDPDYITNEQTDENPQGFFVPGE